MHFSSLKIIIGSGSLSIAVLLLAGCSGGGTSTDAALPNITTQAANIASSLKCFTGSNTGGTSGTCSIDKSTGVATLDTTAPGSYAGVYFASTNNLKGLTLADIKTFSLSLSTPNGSVPSQGSPRANVPVNIGGNAGVVWMYINVCANPNTMPTSPINFLDSTTCSAVGNDTYSDWSQFLTKYGSSVITGTPFFVSDQPGIWTVSNIQISN